MSIYGPNFTMESMNEPISPKRKTISLNRCISRQGMGGITTLLDLMNDISLVTFNLFMN